MNKLHSADSTLEVKQISNSDASATVAKILDNIQNVYALLGPDLLYVIQFCCFNHIKKLNNLSSAFGFQVKLRGQNVRFT